MPDVMVRGWMSEPERMALRRWAFGLKVLEIGCYEGLSTMSLATTAEHVTTIDTFDGRGTNEPRETEGIFRDNMTACGLNEKVRAIRGESVHVMTNGDLGQFDLVFIDGAHDYDSVLADAIAARKLLPPSGFLAFHDYDTGHPGVQKVVDWLRQDGMHAVDQANSAVLLKNAPSPGRVPVNIALLLPTYNGWAMHAGIQHGAAYAHTNHKAGNSIITSTFNDMLCKVMNEKEENGYTHLAMLHADIVPDVRWLDVMLEELEVGNYDMLSAVVPIKNRLGLTSTGLDTIGNPWAVRRLTMTEAAELPETFTAENVPFRETVDGQGQGLLLNSGCWIMRFTRPWFRGLCFRQQDRIMWQTLTKKWGKESISEDWDWSRQLLSRGCRLAATRKVGLYHERPEFHNRSAWGEWPVDRDFLAEAKVIEEAGGVNV